MSAAIDGALRLHPAFTGFRQVMPLAGFSGAAIALVRNPGGAEFVRKAAMTQGSNEALRTQAARQHWLRSELAGAAGVPEILGEGEVDGLYHFDMEFVPSRDSNAFLNSASFEEIRQFAERIEELLRHLSARRLPDRAPPSVPPLLLKLAEIDSRTSGRFAHLLDPLRRLAESLQAFPGEAAATAAHGDLTFENILVGAKLRLWLIDPIQSPVDHYWFDWAKLFQECEGRWYQHRGKQLSSGITHWLRNRWLKTAAEIAPGYAAWHHVLLALTFARILPYAHAPADQDFVAERVRAFCEAASLSAQG